jgi:hypothetical protein
MFDFLRQTTNNNRLGIGCELSSITMVSALTSASANPSTLFLFHAGNSVFLAMVTTALRLNQTFFGKVSKWAV